MSPCAARSRRLMGNPLGSSSRHLAVLISSTIIYNSASEHRCIASNKEGSNDKLAAIQPNQRSARAA